MSVHKNETLQTYLKQLEHFERFLKDQPLMDALIEVTSNYVNDRLAMLLKKRGLDTLRDDWDEDADTEFFASWVRVALIIFAMSEADRDDALAALTIAQTVIQQRPADANTEATFDNDLAAVADLARADWREP